VLAGHGVGENIAGGDGLVIEDVVPDGDVATQVPIDIEQTRSEHDHPHEDSQEEHLREAREQEVEGETWGWGR
jgi:hypothetical protein